MDHRIKLYIEKTGILLAVYLLLKYLLPLVFPFFLAWLTVSLLASASRHFHRKLLPFTASVVAMFFFFTAATLKLTGWLLLEPCKDLIPELQTQLQTWINEYADLADWIPSSLSLHLSTAVPPVLSCAFGIFLYFMAVILFAHDWPDFQRLLTHLPFARPLEHAGKRIAQSLKGWAPCARFVLCLSLSWNVLSDTGSYTSPVQDCGRCLPVWWMHFLSSAPAPSSSPG